MQIVSKLLNDQRIAILAMHIFSVRPRGGDSSGAPCQNPAMRTTSEETTVRLYYLGDSPEGGSAETLCYAPLSQALDIAAAQPEAIQSGLFIATDNDVVAYLDLIES